METTIMPRAAVGAVVFHEGKVLLVRRGQAPASGWWAIPGGKIRPGETFAAAAEREILEETNIRIRAGEVVWVFDHIEYDREGSLSFHYLIVDVLGEYIAGSPEAGDDALEARWVAPEDLARLPVAEETRKLLATRFQFS